MRHPMLSALCTDFPIVSFAWHFRHAGSAANAREYSAKEKEIKINKNKG
jgi:hypothetical protein